MPHPNALPDAKADYVYSLHRQKRLRTGLGPSLPQLTLLMYHCEVPYNRACSCLTQLARSGYRLPAPPETIPAAQLQRLFDVGGAGPAETRQYIATLNTKRAPTH